MTEHTLTRDDQKVTDYLDNHRPTARPVKQDTGVSPRLNELDFLLGRMTVSFDTGVKMEALTRPVLRGHYYQMDLKATYADGSPKLEGQWTIGWSEVDQHFESYYVDSMGTLGVSTSTGWQDGHLEFIGEHVLGEVGVRTRSKDSYTPVDERHFKLEAFVEVNGEWKLYDVQDCSLTPLSEL
ncbi:DUF1579 domain-containing protein [Frankia sp. AiPs1]|uniref:DUF1579 family protein n=1 Tax=Frankia sp. AiPs1 TaxID=573493 RepID=UPI00204434DC|nr:DUF1579 family protein [Frankia sp. AiPs1]MCM3924905.1 DUF1579 domain-containing protein [Frankia sp. AiPs1]